MEPASQGECPSESPATIPQSKDLAVPVPDASSANLSHVSAPQNPHVQQDTLSPSVSPTLPHAVANTASWYFCSTCHYEALALSLKYFTINHVKDSPVCSRILCEHCQTEFLFVSRLREHVKSGVHPLYRRLDCHTCHFPFSNLSERIQHLKENPQCDKRTCYVCKAEFTSTRQWIEHLNENPQCILEPPSQDRQESLAPRNPTPWLANAGKKAEPWACLTCHSQGRVPDAAEAARLHFWRDSPWCRQNRFCVHCQTRFSTGPKLVEHSKTAHPSALYHVCPTCYAEFESPFERIAHLNRDPQCDRRTCRVCRAVFTSTGLWVEHLKLKPQCILHG